ncbi:hypothetical protein GQ464_003880 [Rhodocaloribacter litoris]|uniref:hypothetical protein n=1 Tax=Rhodocaloribacter litoris TaxID=2558931 RepID=UPI0014224F8A|nr:hypothetical protein [Rhodocaloribacter litoris]QXD16097.1 hypothetical protein GQ464_003880 [Rhodocaloribacter litoris]GIV59831.1 MAG: hypothetical protein KatS3mg043_0920 [Rhodothermaceae bacterium]
MYRPVLLLSVLLVLPACTFLEPAGDAAGLYEGFYSWGFEVNSFQPCGRSEAWWVVAGPEGREAAGKLSDGYHEVAPGPYARVFVRLKGTPGKPGRYGHMGMYEREFWLQETLLVREERATDCR